MNRKTLVTIIILVVLLLGVGAYFYFSRKAPVPFAPTGVTFPGGSKPLTSATGTGNEPPTTETAAFTPDSSVALPRLYELHNLPVAGVGFAEAGKVPSLTNTARYIERGLGHIYETHLETLVESRIVNETRSRIMEALWGNSGKSVVIRFIDDKDGGGVIKTSILNLGSAAASFSHSTSTAPVLDFIKTEEIFLPDYIPFMATSEDKGDKLFYLENGVGFSQGAIATFKNTGVSSVFNSAFTEWLPQFPNQQLITLTTKPSALVPGHLFFLNPKTKSVTKILGGINGLTTLTSHDGKFVLFSETKDGVPVTTLYDTVKKIGHPLLQETLPEKCAWGFKNLSLVYCAVPQTIPAATYPDQWYQGLVTFSDALWEIDTTTGNAKKIMTPSEFGATPLDIINPTLSPDDAYLLFVNKVTGTPWVYRVTETTIVQDTAPTTTTTTAASIPQQAPAPSVVTPDMKKIN